MEVFKKSCKESNLILLIFTKYWTFCTSGSAVERSSSNWCLIWTLAWFTFLIFSSSWFFLPTCSLISLTNALSWLLIVCFFLVKFSMSCSSCLKQKFRLIASIIQDALCTTYCIYSLVSTWRYWARWYCEPYVL